MIIASDLISIGIMRRTHGHQGEIQCFMTNEYWDNANATFLFLRLEELFVPFRVLDWRSKGADTLIFRLQGINSEPEAARLTGAEAYMLRTDMCEQEQDSVAWSDLVGYEVIDKETGILGRVTEVNEQTINTLLTLDDGRLMPIHEDFILSIDIDNKQLHVNLPFQI